MGVQVSLRVMERIVNSNNGKVLSLTQGMKTGKVMFLTQGMKTYGSSSSFFYNLGQICPFIRSGFISVGFCYWFDSVCTNFTARHLEPKAIKGIFRFNFNRFYSTSSTRLSLDIDPDIVPVIVYSNADIQKFDILGDNKGKGGVYR